MTYLPPAQFTPSNPGVFNQPVLDDGSGVGGVGGPIITTLPSTTKALAAKYQELGPKLANLPPHVVNALYQYDEQRALRGAQPLGAKQTFNVLSSALTGQAATPEKQRKIGPLSLPGNAIHDLSTILSSIPRLPAALVKEVTQLPQAPQAISEALSAGSPAEVITQLTEVPGLRMAPLAYTIGNIARGEPGEILRHPLMSILDIYPAAKTAGVTGKLAEQISLQGGKLAQLPPIMDMRQTARGNRGVQFMQEIFGKDQRQLAAQETFANKQLERDLIADPSMKFMEEGQSSLTELERQQAFEAASTNQAAIDALPEHMQPHANEIRLQSARLADIGVAEKIVSKAENYGGQGHTEILDNRTYRKWDTKNRLATVARMEGDVRNAIIDPVGSGSDIGSLTTLGAQAVLAHTDFFSNYTQKVHYLRGVTHAIDSLGIDAKPLRDAINRSAPQVPARNRLSQSQLADVFRDFPNRAKELAPVPDAETILNTFKPAARRDPQVAVFINNLKNGNYQNALEAAKGIGKRTKFRPDNWEQVIESTRRLRDQAKFLASDPIFTPKKVESIQKNLDKFVRRNYPARFKPEVVKRAIDKVAVIYNESPDWPVISKLLAEKNFSQYPGLADDVSRAMDEVGRTWQAIRDESPPGQGPAFIHHVSPASATVTAHPQVMPKNMNESWAIKRTNDITSYVPDATIAIPHQAFELLRRQRSEQWIDFISKAHGAHAEAVMSFVDDAGNVVEKPPIMDEFIERARRKYPDSPDKVRVEAERLMKREYGEFDPNQFGYKGAKLTNLGTQDAIWMKKTTLRNLERMARPVENGFTAVMDPVMGMFRTSVLGLSPRFQLNNIVGGGIISAVEDPGILAHFPTMLKSFRAASKGEVDAVPPQVQAVADRIGIGTGMGQLPREALQWNKESATLLHQYLAGKTLGRLYDQASKARELGSNLVQKAYNANQFVDDAYRAAAYMRGFEKARKTMSEAESIEAGIHLSRKILQRWDEMTPLERSIMRYTFPFYGWMKHIIPYVLRYPFDHPWRAEIFSNFARNERNDLGTGLPDRFLNAFFLGHPDKDGNLTAIQMGGMNPFSGVANYMTWQGFVGNLNPVTQAILEAMGVDPMSGGPELYPEVQYDPESGRIVNKGKSFLPSLVSNIIPQSQILLAMLGGSNDFKSMLNSNPEAAARSLLSAGGIPLLWRGFNIPEEQFKAELAREAAQNAAKSKALKSGNIDSLNQYPALRGYVAQLKALQASGKLAPYNPNKQTPSILTALKEAVNPL